MTVEMTNRSMVRMMMALLLFSAPTGANSFLEALLNLPFRLICGISFVAKDFDITNFDAYPTYFREDSTLIFAQTGEYRGVDGITEYVKFITKFSPYVDDEVLIDSSRRIDGYDFGSGQCLFDIVERRRFILNAATSAQDSAPFDAFYFVKIHYDLASGYVTRFYPFFTIPAVKHVAEGVLNSENTIQYVCGVLANQCATYVPDHDPNACKDNFAALPATNGVDGYMDGNSRSCRVLHAAFAAESPQGHCAHVSLNTDDVDPDGANKCSSSAAIRL